jgi:ferrous iron transport protein A
MSHLQLLSDLPSGTHATVAGLVAGANAVQNATAQRLGELGFIAGEPVQLLRRGPGGREPLAVRVGDTQFALRLIEAECIQVQTVQTGQTANMP